MKTIFFMVVALQKPPPHYVPWHENVVCPGFSRCQHVPSVVVLLTCSYSAFPVAGWYINKYKSQAGAAEASWRLLESSLVDQIGAKVILAFRWSISNTVEDISIVLLLALPLTSRITDRMLTKEREGSGILKNPRTLVRTLLNLCYLYYKASFC